VQFISSGLRRWVSNEIKASDLLITIQKIWKTQHLDAVMQRKLRFSQKGHNYSRIRYRRRLDARQRHSH
jgi:hypothetical protein